MKRKITKMITLLGLAAAVGLTTAAQAATPVAVWDGNFTSADSTVGDWTLKANENTVASDGSSITIADGKSGVLLDRATAIAGSPTVIIRYSNLPTPTSATSGYAVFTDKATHSKNSTVTVYDNRTGLAAYGTSGTATAIWCDNYNGTAGNGQTIPSAGTLAFCYQILSDTKTSLYSDSATLYTATGLKSAEDINILGYAIGGLRGKVNSDKYGPAVGMVITKIAVFEEVLTQEQIAAYKFPSEIPLVSWNGDLATTSVKNGFTMTVDSANGTVTDGNAVLTKNTSNNGCKGVAVDWDSETFSNKVMTVLVKYSGFDPTTTSGGNTVLLSTLWGSSTEENNINVKGTNLNLARGVTGGDSGASGTNPTIKNNCTFPSEGMLVAQFTSAGVRVMFFDGTDGNWTTQVDANSATVAKAASFGCLKVGGSISRVGSYWRPGMTVEGLAVFGTTLSDADLAAFAFPAKLSKMYSNRLSTGSTSVPAGQYGIITLAGEGIRATAFDAATKLSNTASGDEITGSYTSIIKKPSGDTDIYAHTLMGWFKVDELPTSTGADNAKTIYAAKSADQNYGGYKVAVGSDGTIYVGQCDNEAWRGTPLSTTTKVGAGAWFHLAVSVPGRVSARSTTATVFVNGVDAGLSSGTFGTNLNGGSCSYVRIGTKDTASGLGISAAGIYVDTAVVTDAYQVKEAALNYSVPYGTAYTTELSESVNESEITNWDPAKTKAFGPYNSITVNNTADAATLTFDETLAMAKLTAVSATGKALTFAGMQNVTFDAYDFSGVIDGTTFGATAASFTADAAFKDYVRKNNQKFTFKGASTYGVTLDYGSTTAERINASPLISSHLVFDGGTHVFKSTSENSGQSFGANATADNPTFYVKNGATLNWYSRNPCGWGVQANANGILRIGDASKIKMMTSEGGTFYWVQQFYLDPGAELEIATGSLCLTGGGSDETKAHFYMPESTEGVATISASSGAFSLTKDSYPGVGVNVGNGSTLNVTANLTATANQAYVAKYGAGTLVFAGTVNGYPGYFQVKGGSLVFSPTSSFHANSTASVDSGATLVFNTTIAEDTFAGVISGAGAVVKRGTGVTKLTASNTYTGGTTVEAGTLMVTATNGSYTVTGGTLDIRANRGVQIASLALGSFLAVKQAATGEDTTISVTGVDALEECDIKDQVVVVSADNDETTLPIKSAVVSGDTLTITIDQTQFEATVDADKNLSTIESEVAPGGTFEQSAQLTIKASNNPTITIDKTLHITKIAIEGQATLKFNNGTKLTSDHFTATEAVVLDCSALAAGEFDVIVGAIADTSKFSVTGVKSTQSVEITETGVKAYFKDSLSRNNPVTGAAETYTHAFIGSVDGDWTRTANWRSVNEGVLKTYTGATYPQKSGGGEGDWEPAVIDGSLILTEANKTIELTKLEGWNPRIAVMNGVTVTANVMNKFGGDRDTWFWVDATSKLTFKAFGSDNSNRDISFYVASEDGLTFQAALAKSRTFTYYLKGDGTVNYEKGVTAGTHKIAQLEVKVGTVEKECRTVAKQKLVNLGATSTANLFSAADGITATCDKAGVTPAYQATKPNVTDALGTYSIAQEADGVYAYVVAYADTWDVVDPLGATLTANTAWEDITWTDSNGHEFTNPAGGHTYNLTGGVFVATQSGAFAEGSAVSLASGTLVLDTTATIGAETYTVDEGATLLVKASGLAASKVTNNGTIAFEGGDAADPIVITGDADFGVTTLAENTYVKNNDTNNRKHLVMGAGATSCYQMTRSGAETGFNEGSALTNLTLVAKSKVWLEHQTLTAENNVRVQADADLCVNGINPVITALTGTGSVSQYGTATLTVACGTASEFSGSSSIAFVIGGTEQLTLSGAYTGALTVNAGAQVALTGSGTPSSLTVDGSLAWDIPDGQTRTLTGALAGSGAITKTGAGELKLSGDMSGFTGTLDYQAGIYDFGADRAVKDHIVLNAAVACKAAQTRGEYGAGKAVEIAGLPDGLAVAVTMFADGSVENLTAVGGKITSSKGTVHIDGMATYADATFTNTVSRPSGDAIISDLSYRSKNDLGLQYDSAVTTDEGKTGVYLKHHPWINGSLSSFLQGSEMTIAVVGQMSPNNNTMFIHWGYTTYSNKGIFLATGGKANEVVVKMNTGTELTDITTMTVPNAATARHVYIITKKDIGDQSTVSVYLDGTPWKTIQLPKIALTGGVQCGSDYGGELQRQNPPVVNSVGADDTALLNVMRIYDRVISTAEIEAYAAAYPYTSENGTSTRKLTVSAENWIGEEEATCWSFRQTSESEPVLSNAATAGSAVEISGTEDVSTAVAVNLDEDVQYESLKISSPGSFGFNKAADKVGKIGIAGLTTIGCPVEIAYGALDISGAPLTFIDKGAIVFDLATLDVTNIVKDTTILLAGDTDETDKITIKNTPVVAGRTVALAYNGTQYVLNITVTPAPFVFTIAQDAQAGQWSFHGIDIHEPDWAAVGSGTIRKAGAGVCEIARHAGFAYEVAEGTLELAAEGDYGTVTVAENAFLDVGTRRGVTVAGAGKVNVTLSAQEDVYGGEAFAAFTKATGATASVGTVKDKDGVAITDPERITIIEGNKVKVKLNPTTVYITGVTPTAQTNFNGSVVEVAYKDLEKGDYGTVEAKMVVNDHEYTKTFSEIPASGTITFNVSAEDAAAGNVRSAVVTVTGKDAVHEVVTGKEASEAYGNTAYLYQGARVEGTPVNWFSTSATDATLNEQGGAWAETKPTAADSKIIIEEDETQERYLDYVFAPKNPQNGQVAVVDMDLAFDAALDELDGAHDGAQAAIRLVTVGDAYRFAALTNGVWTTNAAVAATLGTSYAVRMTLDYGTIPSTVKYEVKVGDAYVEIAKGESGTTKSALASVTFNGTGKLTLMTGSNVTDTVDASLVRDNAGNRYANIDAVPADNRGNLALLWNVFWTPPAAAGNWSIAAGGYRLYVNAADGRLVKFEDGVYTVITDYYEAINLLFGATGVTTNKFMYFTNAVVSGGAAITNLYLLRDVTLAESVAVNRDMAFNGESNILAGAALAVEGGKTFTVEGGHIGIAASDGVTLKGGRFTDASKAAWDVKKPSSYGFSPLAVAERTSYVWQLMDAEKAPKTGEELLPVKTAEGESVSVVVSNEWVATAVPEAKTAAEQAAALSVKQANGLTRLDNEILGLVDAQHEASMANIPVIQPVQSADAAKVTFQLGNVKQKSIAASGARVTYRVFASKTPGGKDGKVSDAAAPAATTQMDLPTSGVLYYTIEVDTGAVK